jgi:hypothetical protein
LARDGGRGVRARVALGVALGALALAPATSSAESTGALASLPQDPASVREYWTPERMRDAIPINPLAGLLEINRRGTIAKPVRRSRLEPYRSHGKVFFTLGGTDYVCSGTAIKAPAENVVWTAGHCVYGEDGLLSTGFASNWEFVPAYRDGDAPFGEWPKEPGGLAATTQWKQSSDGCLPVLSSCGNVAHDFGAANVAELGGRDLQERVGGRPIQFFGPRDRTYKAIGYPQHPSFHNGERMYACKSPYKGADTGQGNPPPMRIRCDMPGGSSGGGWVADGKVASVVSYGYDTEPNNLYGPYQGSSAQSLYNQVKGG